MGAGGVLAEGSQIGRRYRVVKLLGRGGMGAVYRCRDEELKRDVALKIIRPEIAGDTDVIDRFKREIHLSSSVTHRNVLRVYDLGEAEGVRFLTMQFVEGDDLSNLLKKTGALPTPRLVALFRQICEGLAAAHEEGVVHRDLKPQNVLLDAEDHVYLTDFGLAKNLGGSLRTERGVVMGTPSYMSPEQVRGEAVDKRSDIYSLGIVFYEMATGRTPFEGGSMFEVMMRRLSTPPKPVTESNREIPPYLCKVVERCLEVDPGSRFQSVEEILEVLDSSTFRTTVRYEIRRRRRLAAILGLALAVALGVAGVFWLVKRKAAPSRASGQARSILIADFDNKTGDAVFDGTLENALGVALEDASFITTFSRGTARKVASELRPGTGSLSEGVARLVAAREGVGTVVSGTVESRGAGYRVSVTAAEARTGKSIVSADADADGKKEVLGAVATLASKVRGAFGDTKPESERLAAAETFTAGSLEAAHEYSVAQDASFEGKWEAARGGYEKAIKLDPDMGRAYAGLAAVYQNEGRHEEARKALEEALARLERMSDREKYRTRGLYFVTVRKPEKAIEELKTLVARYPADTNGIANLALAHFYRRDMVQALEVGRRFTEIYPKAVPQRNNVGLFAMYAGDFQTAVKEQRTVLELNPKFHLAFVGLALSQLAEGRSAEARETWKKLAALDARGASIAATGLADMLLAEGKPAEAAELLEKGASDDLAGKDTDAAAIKLVALAEAQLALGKDKAAIASAEKAVSLAKGENVLFPAARILVAAGQTPRALALSADLGKSLESDPRAYGKLIEAEAQLRAGKAAEALRTIEAAKVLADTWMGRFLLGRASVEAGAFTEADAELERCFKRRGEATAVFLDEVPSWRLFGPALYWRGRAQEGLKSPSAAGSYKAFLALRPGAGGDPLVADARRRLERK
jgi:tetratricopeptide (TPR) repeat protein/predicted Ser/Thr protein kinase